MYLIEPFASFLGKREAASLPMFKYVIKPLNFILVGRDKKDSKDQREQLILDLAEK
jgi:1-acyl-sn-glycerol-3-phosphate acyltransferase